MNSIEICCNNPSFNKVVELDEEITVDVIERECLSRLRTVLGTGKISVEATVYNEEFAKDCRLWCVHVMMPNGVRFMSLWVREYM